MLTTSNGPPARLISSPKGRLSKRGVKPIMRGNVDSEAVDRLPAVRKPAPRCGERPQTRARKLIFGDVSRTIGAGPRPRGPFLTAKLQPNGSLPQKAYFPRCQRWRFMESPLKPWSNLCGCYRPRIIRGECHVRSLTKLLSGGTS